jgi:hypothetical protein
MTDLEHAAKLLDELLVCHVLMPGGQLDLSIHKEALRVIASCRKANSLFPITVSLAFYMRQQGYLQEDE